MQILKNVVTEAKKNNNERLTRLLHSAKLWVFKNLFRSWFFLQFWIDMLR